MMQSLPETTFYPLQGNPALIDVCTRHRANGMSFEHFRDVHASKACAQLTADDLTRLELLSRPKK